MRNRKGLTLVEVLGAVTLLAIAVLGVTYILQQTSLFSRGNDRNEQSVMIARTVMEEVKSNLKSGAPVALYGQTVDLAPLRSVVPPVQAEIFEPSADDRQYRIVIQTYAADEHPIALKSKTFTVGQYFRLVRVTCIDMAGGKDYVLEAYAEYQ